VPIASPFCAAGNHPRRWQRSYVAIEPNLSPHWLAQPVLREDFMSYANPLPTNRAVRRLGRLPVLAIDLN